MTLTALAGFTRKFIIFFTLAIFLGIVSFFAYRIWYTRYLASLPPPEEKPEVKWGVLPWPNFPTSTTSANNFNFSIDTQSGLLSLEKFSKIGKVYFIPKGVVTFLASQKASDLAGKFGINAQPEVLSETRYKFSSADKNIMIDLDTSNFVYNKEASSTAQQAKTITDDSNKLADDFKYFLSANNLLPDDLKDGQTKIIYLKFAGNNLVAADQNEATAIRLSLWPKPIDKKELLTQNPDIGLVNATFTRGATILENYLSLNYTFWPVDQTIFTTYPLKTAETAFNDLKLGKGSVILSPDKTSVSITSIKLAYFESNQYSPYLQPIFVFEGPGFMAYVPAITDQYLSAR